MQASKAEMESLGGEVELDESYFGAKRVRGWKVPVFGIESFWSFAKRRMAKFHGIPSDRFNINLKESEMRFNYRKKDFYARLQKILKKNFSNLLVRTLIFFVTLKDDHHLSSR